MRYRMARLGVNVADHVGERGDSRRLARLAGGAVAPAALARWLVAARARRSSRPTTTRARIRRDVSLVVVHSISLPPGEYGGDAIERLFTNPLDWDAHPYFQSIRGLRCRRTS